MHGLVRSTLAFLLLAAALPASATFHLWVMNELYSNADGSVQFLELTAQSSGQQFMNGHTLTATGGGSTRSFTFDRDLPLDSLGRRMLIGTQGFAALGIVAPDYVVPNGFFTRTGGSINFGESSDVWNYGTLPTGNLSLSRDGSTAANSPRNFAGATGTVSGTTTPVTSFNVQAMWWRPSESGWGINIVHQGTTLFATWFTYDADNTDLWLVASDVRLVGNNTYTGDLVRANTGSPFGLVPYDPTRNSASVVGSVTFTFTDANNGTVTHTVNGVTQTKPITKFLYSSPVPTCVAGTTTGTVSYQDLWWRSPALSENGSGINIIHQGDILFVTWFTYDTDGSQMWLVMDSAARTGPGVYTGDVKQARGSPVNLIPFDPNRFGATTVGTGTFTFTSPDAGSFTYTVKGFTQTKPIIRFVYSSPTTTCAFPVAENEGGMMYPPDPY
jgi:hypothetical protein